MATGPPRTPRPPGKQTRRSENEGGGLKAKLLRLFEGLGDEERRRSMEEAIKILQNGLQSIPSVPP